MDLVDDQAAHLTQRDTQRRRPAHRLELLRRRHPQIGLAGPLHVDHVLTGKTLHPQPLRTPGGKLAVKLIGQ